jgi:chemotaxis protein methyltransferase CheR
MLAATAPSLTMSQPHTVRTSAADSGNYPILHDAEFEFIRHVVGQNAGIVLGPNKRHLVQGRIARRMRELGLRTYEAYCEHVRQSGPEELVGLINALTTNVTSFFRENHHFEALASTMLPEAIKRNAASRRIRIWSAGCSTGEEAYCLAMIASELVPSSPHWDVKILATDIDSNVINQAKQGVYGMDRVSSVSEARLRKFFRRGTGDQAGNVRVREELAQRVTFRTLNLIHEWPMRGRFDVLFCRNVMIYFDQPTRERLVSRFGQIVVPEGYLCIGHSESIHGAGLPFKLVGKTIYQRQREPL